VILLPCRGLLQPLDCDADSQLQPDDSVTGGLYEWVCRGVDFPVQANRDVVIAAISDNGLALIHAGEDALPHVLKWAHINMNTSKTIYSVAHSTKQTISLHILLSKLYRPTFY
jgi:hypothetical protein